ncbi:Phosphoribosylformylglycinamidine synthase subunit PurL [Candidatus Bilamarchaeum dharawalense]|uniref:Phosphoribosylformylglycinamidine synthase subunit PurL n=1 Tax=Candidatus Bilamarchaeum dharawalense TaxID=2885759 RepID=A0A5E4LRN3_9ARCH|nr:Phosphoribosylformylglycinamidine synthase subunit PurL [Candidatus Bilamarchaeum dharawalense]
MTKTHIKDVQGDQLKERIQKTLNLSVQCHFLDVYNLAEKISPEEFQTLATDVFTDVITQDFSFQEPLFKNCWRIEIGMLPGVTDNIGHTASEAIKDKLDRNLAVYYSRMYAISGPVDEFLCEKIAAMLHNPLVEKFHIYPPDEETKPYLPIVKIPHEPSVQKISLHMGEERFQALAKERLLSLSYEEFEAIKHHLKLEKVLSGRKKVGLDGKITDVELEALAQTWSEHCKHKIFNAKISYDENGEIHAINSIFKTFIRGATEQVKKPYIVSVFKDNGGIIKFNHEYDIAVKVETHNAPSALDPYGGALTGVLGVQRDIMGTGMGANPIANVDILCFGPLDAKADDVPKGVLHPAVIADGVVKGVEHGGNKMGIPTVNGSIIFDKDYTCRPLVYCGTIGIMPSMVGDKRTSEKNIEPGYLAVMVGGRIGKDGIHGATFSSMQIDASTPQSVVQIGDPITQKKMLDFILDARDKLLYEAVTDNGAGGLSSSVGELAQISNGCEIYLDKCPLKYPGLDPWEILVSESQERMTLAVKPEKVVELAALAKIHDVELNVVGKFTDSKKFHALYKDETVAYLDMEFLHNGLPQLKLNASWKKLMYPEPNIGAFEPGEVLKKLLSSPNITTKESVIRRYDHEVKGQSVIKPIMIGPSDGAVIRPVYTSDEGLAIAHGICPRYVQDGYSMAALAFDEAVRNAIAVGAKFGYLACLDNFSWPDPVKSAKTPDGEQKLGSLVRACIALYDCATNYGVPIISGKDSMKNDYYSAGKKYSIPPTLLVTVVGKVASIKKARSSEFKNPGDIIYVLGTTRDELGGSEFYKLFGGIGNTPPQLYPDEHIPLYKALSTAMEEGLVSSAHDVSDGGIAVTFAESASAFLLGAELDLSQINKDTEDNISLLFSESAGRFIVSVNPDNVEKFEKIMFKLACKKAGRVRGDKRFIIRNADETLINDSIEDVRASYLKGVKIA